MGSRIWSGGKRRKPFLCPVCDRKRFKTERKLKAHLDRIHGRMTDDDPFKRDKHAK